jgi:hypothetical protein
MDRSRFGNKFGRSTLGNVSVDIMALNKAASRNQKILADVGWFLGWVAIHSSLQPLSVRRLPSNATSRVERPSAPF